MTEPIQNSDSDSLTFADEIDPVTEIKLTPWKVLIADDEPDVHLATKLVLDGFMFQGRKIAFIDAYSGNEACELLQQHPDTAVVFLDVVMESENAGLIAVRRIRDEIKNRLVRIILRTGQPGQAPEKSVVLNYHINDYKAKAEMTSEKLFTTLVSALRSYQDLQTIESSRRGLVKVLDAASSMDFRSRSLFISGLLTQFGSVMELGQTDLMLIRKGDVGQSDTILAACGDFDPFIGEPIQDVLDPESVDMVRKAFSGQTFHIDPYRSIHLISLPGLRDVAVYLSGVRAISEAELDLMTIFCKKIVLAYDNYESVEQARYDQNVEIALLTRVTGHASYLPVSHATNRGRLSRDIAIQIKEAGLSVLMEAHFDEVIERAAALADLGNHAIPTAVLEKNGPLTDDELALVRQHPHLGASLLDEALDQMMGGRVALLAKQIALTHHEHFDGTGYPHQLAGNEIPLAGRIAALADCFMALTTRRPWRDAFPHDEAVAMIVQQAGKKFDPALIESFTVVADAYREPA